MAKHLRTQRHHKQFSTLLKENGIKFEMKEAEWLNSMNTVSGRIYRYSGNGQKRVVYEVSHVLPPDDYIIVSAMFDGEATTRQVRDAFNSDYNPKPE